MAGVLLSTADIPEQRQFAHWQDYICDSLVGLDCTSPTREKFQGAICNRKFGELQLSTMTSDQMCLQRSRARIARAREDDFLVAFEGRAQSYGSQDGREAVLDVDDFALFDSTRPYDVRFKPGFKHFVLKIPRSALLSRLGNPNAVTGSRITGRSGAGRIASQFFRELEQQLDSLDRLQADRLGQIGLDLLAAALAGMSAASNQGRSTIKTAWVARIKVLTNSRLGDPTLSPGSIASSLGISVRYLNSLFSNEELSFDRWIWELRLQRCHAALADPSQLARSISDIALNWGFSDMAHFSRSFRQRFGCSPREARHRVTP
ncbi:helix-turn-helix domain-containing protein [Bradyrhizobium sp. LA7.1]|uniref:AraC-like ligand-binding domain-containing protein n=1 Tax=Bradyrhizobium sp. LA7.1 TaxID=3156324 RepID=UPI00339B01BC